MVSGRLLIDASQTADQKDGRLESDYDLQNYFELWPVVPSNAEVKSLTNLYDLFKFVTSRTSKF